MIKMQKQIPTQVRDEDVRPEDYTDGLDVKVRVRKIADGNRYLLTAKARSIEEVEALRARGFRAFPFRYSDDKGGVTA